MANSKIPMFPVKIDEFVADIHTKYVYLYANNDRFHMTAEYLSVLQNGDEKMTALRNKAQNVDTRTREDVAKQNEYMSIVESLYRIAINSYVVPNPDRTATDYEMLRIPKPGPHSPLPVPTRAPGIGYIYSRDFIVYIPFFDAETEKRSKPVGVAGIEIYYHLGGETPPPIHDMSERMIATATPATITFVPDDHGKTLWIAARYVGTRGDYSPWTEPYSVLIIR